jgi:hypothetical protein
MNTVIVITIKSVYGRDTIYPVNDQAKRLANLVGTKTLTQQTIRDAMGMGFQIEYVDAYHAANTSESKELVK